MGKHSEWRKLAKKARRKRIRQAKAKLRDLLEEEERAKREKSPNYKIWLEQQERIEEFQAREEARLAVERDLQWRKAEEEAQKQWQELQKKLAAAKEERLRQNEKIILEWEQEQKRQKELKEQKEKEAQERLRQQEILDEEVNDFLVNGGYTPEHLKTKFETNPNKPLCPFFQKTSTCRFYDVCSRNHVRPGISRILLVTNFYSHYSLEANENEHGSDSSLEFEQYETYDHYKEFFYDVVPELETFGGIKLFKTCCNHEPHLRGNVYIEYFSTRSALKCFKSLNGRWYGGKQLNVEFCNIDSWRTAICEMEHQKGGTGDGLNLQNRYQRTTIVMKGMTVVVERLKSVVTGQGREINLTDKDIPKSGKKNIPNQDPEHRKEDHGPEVQIDEAVQEVPQGDLINHEDYNIYLFPLYG
ncbi:hypothetical protein NQ315_004763 [Exocentrus adspersus]|uniref:Uncharacterized protein n=1 Tax=Exocentrus adspersus TaxID=1586481 RepID=A0AAV8W2T4_9CUCU|nr:hypothetical protein NQ315_004763 [Exocentrus adspersus]